MSHPVPTGGEPRRDPHCCTACGHRFEVVYTGDPLESPVLVDVKCPTCGKAVAVSVPAGAARSVAVERERGPEPVTGGGD